MQTVAGIKAKKKNHLTELFSIRHLIKYPPPRVIQFMHQIQLLTFQNHPTSFICTICVQTYFEYLFQTFDGVQQCTNLTVITKFSLPTSYFTTTPLYSIDSILTLPFAGAQQSILVGGAYCGFHTVMFIPRLFSVSFFFLVLSRSHHERQRIGLD